MTPKAGHTFTAGPAFVSGVRFKMNGSDWHAVNRYDEAKKQDANIACVGFDPRTGDGLADAHFIAESFTVAHETGLTPRQLAKRSADLLAALRELVRCVRGGDEASGVSTDDALQDADTAIANAEGCAS